MRKEAQEGLELKSFVKRTHKELNPEKMILFGSRARGDNLVESDYDFVIVAERFNGWDFHKRIVETLRLTKPAFAVDLICVTPREFAIRKQQISIIQEAVREGVVLL